MIRSAWQKTRLQSLVWLILSAAVAMPTKALADWHQHQETIFGTSFALEFWAQTPADAETVIDQVVAEMWRLHYMLSSYEAESELSQINAQAAFDVVSVSAELFALLDRSLYYAVLSEGAFDPSVSSLGRYYDYQQAEKPSQQQIQQLRQAINFEWIELDKEQQTVRFQHPDMKLDLGGIAKGYAMDRAAEILTDLGIEHARVSAGGDMRILGDKAGRPWVIGIRNPRKQETAIRLPLESTAVSTSGDYERFFIDTDTGERVHHILNPKTGVSADQLTGVTVLGPTGFDTDPLSTAVFVLGVEKGLTLINSLPEYDAIMIDTRGQLHYSSGLVSP